SLFCQLYNHVGRACLAVIRIFPCPRSSATNFPPVAARRKLSRFHSQHTPFFAAFPFCSASLSRFAADWPFSGECHCLFSGLERNMNCNSVPCVDNFQHSSISL